MANLRLAPLVGPTPSLFDFARSQLPARTHVVRRNTTAREAVAEQVMSEVANGASVPVRDQPGCCGLGPVPQTWERFLCV